MLERTGLPYASAARGVDRAGTTARWHIRTVMTCISASVLVP
jgi:hypothetical protein